MSLSQRQISLIQSSFAKVEPIADQAADIFYNKLFSYDPALRKLFKHDIKSQGRKLMSTLKVAVKGLNDTATLVPVLEKLAVGHLRYGVKSEHYTLVGNALLNTLKTGLGENWNSELRQAWVDCIRLIISVMREKAYP